MLIGFCSGGILAALAAAVLAATGQPDRLAAFALAVTVLDNTDAGTAGALADRHLAAAAKALPRRRGLPRRADLAEVFAWLRPGDLVWNYWVNNYLLGRTPAAFDVLFWNADTTRMRADCTPTSSTWPWTTRSSPGRRDRPGAPVDLSRSRGRHLPGRRDRRPPDPVAELLPEHAAARRREPVRAVDQRPHRRAGQPAGQPEGHLPGDQGEPRRPAGVARTAHTSRAAGGRTPSPGSASGAAPTRRHRGSWAAAACDR